MFECTAIHEHFTPKPHGPKNPAPTTSTEVQAHADLVAKNDPKVVDAYCRVRFDACSEGPSGELPVSKRGHIEIAYPLRAESLPFKVGEFFGITFSKCSPPEHVRVARAQAEKDAAAAAAGAAPVATADDDL